MQNCDNTDIVDRKVNKLNFLINKLKKIRSVQGGLLQLSELASKVQDLSEFYPALNRVVSTILQAENFYIALENEHQELKLVYFVDEKDDSSLPDAHNLEEGITGFVYKTGETVLCDKNEYLELVADNQFKQLGSEPELWFGVPLLRSGRCIGVMAVQSYHKKVGVTEQTQALFENLGLNFMTAVNRIKRRELLEQEVKIRTKQLQEINEDLTQEILQRQQAEELQEVLFQISEMSASNINMDAFYQQLHQALANLMDVNNCYIALIDEDTLSFPFFVDKYRDECEPRTITNGLTEYTIRTKTSHLVDSLESTRLQDSGEICRELFNSEHISTCWLGAPLIIDDEVIGVITVQAYDNDSIYSEKDLQLLNFVSHHIARAIERKLTAEALQKSYDVLEAKISERTKELRQTNLFLRLQVEERKKAEQKLFHQANHDALTNLPNRSLFQSKVEVTLARAKRHPEHNFALLFIDLDNFKLINDNFGHQVGDDFLIEISNRIKSCVRDNDIVARLGGDEFVVLLDLIPNSELAEEIASRIIDDVQQPYCFDAKEVFSGASIGIALFEHEYQDVDSIMRDADLAMYHAKSSGRGQYVLFNSDLKTQVSDSESFSTIMHNAIADKQLYLSQCPMYSLSANLISCMLITPKWQHVMLGDINTEQCKNQIAQADLSLAFDYEYLVQIPKVIENKNSMYLMPMSTAHLLHIRLVNNLIQEIKAAGLADTLCLLFSEADLVKLHHVEIKNLKLLKRAGIKIGINNFGQANSAIGLFAKAAFDFVLFDAKMIKSLAASPIEAALFKSALNLTLEFNARPVVLGVDLEQHLERVKELRLDLICGEYVKKKLVDSTELGQRLTFQHSA